MKKYETWEMIRALSTNKELRFTCLNGMEKTGDITAINGKVVWADDGCAVHVMTDGILKWVISFKVSFKEALCRMQDGELMSYDKHYYNFTNGNFFEVTKNGKPNRACVFESRMIDGEWFTA